MLKDSSQLLNTNKCSDNHRHLLPQRLQASRPPSKNPIAEQDLLKHQQQDISSSIVPYAQIQNKPMTKIIQRSITAPSCDPTGDEQSKLQDTMESFYIRRNSQTHHINHAKLQHQYNVTKVHMKRD